MSDEKVSLEVVQNRRRWVERLARCEDEQWHGNLRGQHGELCVIAVAMVELDVWLHDGSFRAATGLPGGCETDLIEANDDEKLTFPELAELLRSDAWFGPDLDRVVR